MSPRSRRIAVLAERGLAPAGALRFPYSRLTTASIVREALAEDCADNDITAIATIVSDRRARCVMVARQAGIIAGIALAREAFKQRDANASVRNAVKDGQAVSTGTPVIFITGHARGLLSAERVALNYMQRLSGVATLTAEFVKAVKGTGARILDTRKTTPGWRRLEKYAVRAGGGTNHRMDLSSAVLIKDNHLVALNGDVALAIQRARAIAPRNTPVEVECDRVEQVKSAAGAVGHRDSRIPVSRKRRNHSLARAYCCPMILVSRWAWVGAFALVACASGNTSSTSGAGKTTQADCDKIAEDIRTHGGRVGVCSSTAPADVERFGKACAALKDCNDKVDAGP